MINNKHIREEVSRCQDSISFLGGGPGGSGQDWVGRVSSFDFLRVKWTGVCWRGGEKGRPKTQNLQNL